MTSEAVIEENYEGETLEDLQREMEEQEAREQAEAEKPTTEEKAKAREFAQDMNNTFLWLVNRTQCPHIDVDQIIDREQGTEALVPLAEKWGGETPEWLKPFKPYFAAGIYMGTTIITARQAERIAKEQLEQQRANHGEESGSGTAE